VVKGLQGLGKSVLLQLAFEGILGSGNSRANAGRRGLLASFRESYPNNAIMMISLIHDGLVTLYSPWRG